MRYRLITRLVTIIHHHVEAKDADEALDLLEAGDPRVVEVWSTAADDEPEVEEDPETLAEEHDRLVHPDGSRCGDGCDRPPRP